MNPSSVLIKFFPCFKIKAGTSAVKKMEVFIGLISLIMIKLTLGSAFCKHTLKL